MDDRVKLTSAINQATDLAMRTDDFLNRHDPSYNYSPTVSGWENSRRATLSLACLFVTQDVSQLQGHIDLLEEIGEVKPLYEDAVYQLLSELQELRAQFTTQELAVLESTLSTMRDGAAPTQTEKTKDTIQQEHLAQATLYQFWRNESDLRPESLAWRDNLTVKEQGWVDRWQELHELWGDETSEEWTHEWREELSPQEMVMVEQWDRNFHYGAQAACKEILDQQKQTAQAIPCLKERLSDARQRCAAQQVAPSDKPQKQENER